MLEIVFLSMVLNAPCDGGVCVPPAVVEGVEVRVAAPVKKAARVAVGVGRRVVRAVAALRILKRGCERRQAQRQARRSHRRH